MKKIITLLFAFFLIVSCGDDPVTEAVQGAEGGECYPNKTCNDGLVCSESNICVKNGGSEDSGENHDSDNSDTVPDNEQPDGDDGDTIPENGAECGNGTLESGEICEKGDTKHCSEIDNSYKSGDVECNDSCSGWLTVNCMASELEPLASFPAVTFEVEYLYNGMNAYLEAENQVHELWETSLFNASITMNGETYSIPNPQANVHWIAAYYDSSALSFYQSSWLCDDEMNCQYATPSVIFGAALSSLSDGNKLSIGISDENQVNMIIEDVLTTNSEQDCVMLVGYGTLTVDSVNIAAGEAGNFKFTTSKIGLYLPAVTPEGNMTNELENAGYTICK